MAFTNRCNLQCASCLNDSAPTGEFGLPTETLLQVLDWLAEQDEPQVDFSGGEPFVRPDVLVLIRRARQLDIQVNVCTNGCLVNDEIATLLAGARRITITFYGRAEFHDWVTGAPGSFERAMHAVRLLRGTRARLRANVVMLAGAVPDMPALAEELQQAGASEIKFSLAQPAGRAAGLVQDLASRAESAELSHWLGDQRRLHIPVTMQDFGRRPFACEIPGKSSLFLTHDGRIYPCPLFRNLGVDMGQITGSQSARLVLEKLAWDRPLELVGRSGQGRCPAVEMGLFQDLQGARVHHRCPPVVERCTEWSGEIGLTS